MINSLAVERYGIIVHKHYQSIKFLLDIAKRMDLLDRIEPPVTMKNKYSEMLFNGSLPSSTGFGEKEAFRHYLYCLHKQCQNSVLETYAETKIYMF